MHPLLLLPAALVGYLAGLVGGKKRVASSPIPGVSVGDWENFVKAMAVAEPGHVSDRGKLGLFQMNARQLADSSVGAMKGARKGSFRGRDGIWLGQWQEPLTETEFLGNIPLQYAAFTRSMRAAAPKVSELVGTEVDLGNEIDPPDKHVASLSGLLGVCHAAGLAGTASWVKEPSVRAHFTETSSLFRRTNGIF